jgi:endonuclease YncB( thermonuclease family)
MPSDSLQEKPWLKRLFFILFIFAWVIFLTPLAGIAEERTAFVAYVIDGDTIILQDGERVRYKGINAPEIPRKDDSGEPFGIEAKKRNEELVKQKKVKIIYDKEAQRDRFGRLLADVYLEDGSFVTEILLKDSLACLCYGRVDNGLLSIQRKAIDAKKGIWSLPPQKEEEHYIGNLRSMVFHRPDCPFGHKIAKDNKVVMKTRNEASKKGFCPCKRCRP